jgi:transposase
MQTITTIGLDIAKSVFQVHGVDAAGQVVIRRQLKRRAVLAFFQKLPSCLVGIEACASSHYWSRELQVLGHTVRLMPPAYVKPYVKRQKNDMADAEAICEAVTRANMRFVPTKMPEQQSCLMLHRTRHLFIRQQTAVINSIRAHLSEFGIVAPVGRKGVTELLHVVADPNDKRVSEVARACLAALGTQLLALKEQILEFDRMIMVWHRSNQTSRRLHYIPGVGPMLATALVASIADPRTSRPGLGWFQSSTQAGASSGSAASANRVIAIYAACSWPEHLPSSATPKSMAPGIGPGSRRCWRESRPRSPPSRLPTRLHGWPGP